MGSVRFKRFRFRFGLNFQKPEPIRSLIQKVPKTPGHHPNSRVLSAILAYAISPKPFFRCRFRQLRVYLEKKVLAQTALADLRFSTNFFLEKTGAKSLFPLVFVAKDYGFHVF